MQLSVDFFVLAVAAAIAYAAFRNHRSKTGGPSTASKEFLIENKDQEFFSAELDIGLDYRPKPSHFRSHYIFDTCRTDCIYEYRLDGTDVSSRLIDQQYEDIGVPRHNDIRDGVVLESDMRKRDAAQQFHIGSVEDKIGELKAEVQWQKMSSLSWHGLKYFILSKKLPQADARRYLRQELERFKTGDAAFYREASKYGLEPDDSSLDRFKLADGKQELSPENWQSLFASAESCGITRLEFSWGKKLKGVLEKLLGD